LQPACVDVCPTGTRVFGDLNDSSSPVSEFIRNNQVQVLKPESGNAPMCFYVGIDKDVS
jgi:Fe-S-cluster-containing dehydrogenase component